MRFNPFLKDLSIVTKQGDAIPLELNWGQQIYLDEIHRQWDADRPVRIIVLKARQIGISTLTEAILFCMSQIWSNLRARVVAHDNDATQGLLEMSQYYWETWPYNGLRTLKYNSRMELAWVEHKSSIRVSTAKNTKAGRSKTLRALHASEVAFWDDPDTLMLGLMNSIPNLPGTFVCLESTANGVGNWFHNTWMAAEEGESEYVPIFLPWHKHPEYTAEYEGLSPAITGPLSEEERVLKRMGISDGRLVWRRHAIRNKCGRDINKFHQEYPTVPEEAFIATGTNVFPVDKVRACYEPSTGLKGRLIETSKGIEFIADATGPLTIFSTPSSNLEWGQYLIAGDPTKASRGDYACAQVINRRTYEQVAVWRYKIDPMHFGTELARLGKFYNNAILAPEIQGGGYATIGYLHAINYPNLWQNRMAEKLPGVMKDSWGWESTAKTKEWAVGALLKLIVDGDIKIHDRVTYHELQVYIKRPNGDYGNAEGEGKGHDDTVSALAIAVVCNMAEPPLPPFGSQQVGADLGPVWEAWEEYQQEMADA